MSVVLIVDNGSFTAAVLFSTSDAAMRWEDKHDKEVSSLGCVPIYSRRDVLSSSVEPSDEVVEQAVLGEPYERQNG